MKNILGIYTEYKIIPNLQEHQIRVASVGKITADSLAGDIDRTGIVCALLLHDMGNILKFDFSVFPETLEPLGLAYWESVKEEYREKYGSDEHLATLLIAKELGVAERIISYIDSTGFTKIPYNLKEGSMEEKICNYSDMRVGPFGLLSLEDRMNEGWQRYKDRKDRTLARDEEREIIVRDAFLLEGSIFENSTLKPEDLNDVSIESTVKDLKTWII